jgi:hypothetical protein
VKSVLIAAVLAIACGAVYGQAFERGQKRERDHERRHRDERPVERQTSDGPVKLDRVRPPETQRRRREPDSQPSPAEQLQRELYEQRQSRQR